MRFLEFRQEIFDLLGVLILDVFGKELFEGCEHVVQQMRGVWRNPHLFEEIIFAFFGNNEDIVPAQNDTGLIFPSLVEVLEGFVECGLE